MTLSDFEDIKDILVDEFDEFWKPSILESELNSENSKYIVAIMNNEIVGLAGIKYNFDTLEIMNIVTKKTQRRKGIGLVLLNNLIKLSKDYCVDKIELEVNEKNLPAINLYKKIGFKQVGLRKKYYDNNFDAILMDYNL